MCVCEEREMTLHVYLCHLVCTCGALEECEHFGISTQVSRTVHQLTIGTQSLALAISAAFSSICKKVSEHHISEHTPIHHCQLEHIK